MKIAFDYQVFSWQEYGGVSRYACELASGLLSACQQDVSVVSPLYVNQYLRAAPAQIKVFGVHVPKLPKTARIYQAVNQLVAGPVFKLIGPDIVHETYYSSKRLAPKSAKVVLTVYDMIHEHFRDSFNRNDRTSMDKATAVSRADHVVCISEQTKSDLISLLDVDPGKISVVHLGFKLPISAGQSEQLNTQRRPFLLYVGARHGYKNFEGLLRAYGNSAFLRTNFDLICFGGGRFSENEHSLMQQLAIPEGRVKQVSGNDQLLESYYRSAAIFVYPSMYEGFGIPPLEAMSFDCPVACSDVSSIPEVVGDAAAMFDPHHADAIAAVLERTLQDEGARLALISRGQERVTHFSWERCARETLDVYRKVLA